MSRTKATAWNSRDVQKISPTSSNELIMRVFHIDLEKAIELKRAFTAMAKEEQRKRNIPFDVAFRNVVNAPLSQVPFAGQLIPYHLLAWAYYYKVDFPDIVTMRKIMEGVYQRLLPLLSRKGHLAQTDIYWDKILSIFWWFGPHIKCAPIPDDHLNRLVDSQSLLGAIDLFAETEGKISSCQLIRASRFASSRGISLAAIKCFLKQHGKERIDDLNEWMDLEVLDQQFLYELIEAPELVRALHHDQVVFLGRLRRKHPETRDLLVLARKFKNELLSHHPSIP